MNTSKALATLYSIIEKEMGTVRAKQSVSTAVQLVISDILDEKLPVTAEEIEKRLESYVNDYVEVAAKTSAA